MTSLRAIKDESPALSEDELEKQGNALASKIKKAAVEAVGKSMNPEFVGGGTTLTVAELKRWHSLAISARNAWNDVEALTSELIHEVQKTTDAMTVMKYREISPGNYVYERVARSEGTEEK